MNVKPLTNKDTARKARINKAVHHFYSHQQVMITSHLRDLIAIVYPEHARRIYEVETANGLRYMLRIERDVPDFEAETEELI